MMNWIMQCDAVFFVGSVLFLLAGIFSMCYTTICIGDLKKIYKKYGRGKELLNGITMIAMMILFTVMMYGASWNNFNYWLS